MNAPAGGGGGGSFGVGDVLKIGGIAVIGYIVINALLHPDYRQSNPTPNYVTQESSAPVSRPQYQPPRRQYYVGGPCTMGAPYNEQGYVWPDNRCHHLPPNYGR